MKFRYSPVALAVFAALGSLTVTPATAQQTQAQPQALERVTITGSNIRRTDQETVAPVEVITRESIERTGLQTVADVLIKLPQMGSGAFSESPNSFASGATTISLRSLGEKATLVLLNGRRVAGYGFAQNLNDTIVDLSQIPTAAVDRIEILLDGASAIYGSDAIAGVVNVILRRDYQGIDVGANVGFYQGKNDYRANITAGFGDLGKQKFNVMGILDYYKRDGLTMADTDFGADRDYRDREGGRNFQSLTGGGTWSDLNLAGQRATTGNLRRAISQCPNPVNYSQASALGLLNINQMNQPLGGPNTLNSAGNVSVFNLNQPGNTWCPIDYAKFFQVLPEQEKIAFLGRGTVDFSEKVQGYAELGYSQNKVDFIYQPAGVASTRLSLVPGTTNLQTSPFNQRFAPGASGNPLPVTATYASVYNDFGPRTTDNTSDQFRLLAGLKYSVGNWDLDSAAWYSYSDVEMVYTSSYTAGTIAALNMPNTLQPPTPTVSGGAYNLDQPSLNSQALRDSMFGPDTRKSKSTLKAIDTKGTTEVGTLPGGPIGLALGIEYRDESIEDTPSQLAAAGGLLGRGSTYVNGSRTDLAMYGELALPLTRQLEGQLALRYDHYSDFGTALTPKIGLKFKPANELLLRANWGRGFKAPSLPEISPSTSFFFLNGVQDPNAPGGEATVNTAGNLNGNPNLQPEKSRTFTMGAVWEPTANFSVGVSYYDIKWNNQVTSPNYQDIINTNNPSNVFRDQNGNLYLVTGQYTNIGETQTSGVDIDARYKVSTAYGRWGGRLNATYVDSYEINGQEMAGTNRAWISTPIAAIPRWKGLLAVDWEQGPWVAQLTMNYIHGYWRANGYEGGGDPTLFTPATGGSRLPQNGTLDKRSPSYTTFDLYGRYNVTPKFTINASIVNIFDLEPPYDPSFSQTYFYDQFSGYDIRGRTYRLGASYKF